MLFFDGGLGLIMFGVWLFCIIDVITTPDGQCRNLPKLVWLLIVILLVDLGSIAWLIAGRSWHRGAEKAAARRPTGVPNPDDDEEFLATLRTRAAEQRRRAREAQQRETGISRAMTDVTPERPLGEKGSQQVHPDKPDREESPAHGDPNETPPGQPQHEPRNPDEKQW